MTQAEFLRKISGLRGYSDKREDLILDALDHPFKGVKDRFSYQELYERITEESGNYPDPKTIYKVMREIAEKSKFGGGAKADGKYPCEYCNGKRGHLSCDKYGRSFFEFCEECKRTGRQFERPENPPKMISDEKFAELMELLRRGESFPSHQIDKSGKPGQRDLIKIGE